MSQQGLDTASDVRPHLDCIVAAGYKFIGRYLASHSAIPGKILTPAEAQAIAAAGLQIVSIWESGSPTSKAYFTEARGNADATAAIALSQSVGQPDGVPIYFTVDYDATLADIEGPITDYFRAIFETVAYSGRDPLICVYGSGLVCKELLSEGDAAKAWLSEASGWSGYKEFYASGKASIVQFDGSVCGLPSDVTDRDTGFNDFGAWVPVMATVV